MRVCLVTGSLPTMDCGVGDYTWQLARYLAVSESVTVVTSDRPAIRDFNASRPPVPRLEVRPVINRWDLRSLPALRRAVLDCRPDLVHIQYATAAFDTAAGINWLAASLQWGALRVPVVTTLHDPSGPRLFPKAGRLRAAHVRLLCRSSARVCCPDCLVRDWLTANNMGERARQIPVGVNVAPAHDYRAGRPHAEGESAAAMAARALLGREHPAVFSGGHVLVSFGNLHPDKDYESVLEALQRLTSAGGAGCSEDRVLGARCSVLGSDRIGLVGSVWEPSTEYRAPSTLSSEHRPAVDWRRAHWVLVGGAGRGADTRRMREVQALADRAGLAGRVHLVGFAPPERVSAWLAVADLCVMLLPQGATDARSSLLVALAHGNATVVVGRGVFSDTMRDGEHLCWSPTGDAPRLAALLDRLMGDAAARTRLGRAARRLTDRHFGWPRIAEATIGVYRELATTTGVEVLGCWGVRAGQVPPVGPNTLTP
jgi:glycosyltransferase involved in cell wall biosynthesis